MYTSKKIVEPFPLFGEEAVINSREHANQILKENSYYFFVIGFLEIIVYIIAKNINYGENVNIVLFFGVIDFVIGFFIRVACSRIASIVAFIIYLSAFLTRFPELGFSWPLLLILMLLAASFRSIKASFYFNRK